MFLGPALRVSILAALALTEQGEERECLCYTRPSAVGEFFVATIALSKDNFEQVVTGNDMVLIDFWAPWCGPCRGFAPVFEAASEKHKDIVFAKVNTEEEQELAASFNIRSIPTLMFFRERVILYSEAGTLPGSALEQVIAKGKELDMAVVHKEIAERGAGAERRA
jgi:thioredoxin